MAGTIVGFLTGWAQQVLGTDALLAGEALAASLGTGSTFLPFFVFFLAGRLLVDATHGKLHFTAPLTAITAAAIGVIVNLALFFAGRAP